MREGRKRGHLPWGVGVVVHVAVSSLGQSDVFVVDAIDGADLEAAGGSDGHSSGVDACFLARGDVCADQIAGSEAEVLLAA